MPDMWVAECLPCEWEFQHDSEIGAIDAARNHVFDRHRDVPSEQRAAQKIGHVQLRTVPSLPPVEKESAGPPQPGEPLLAQHQPAEGGPAESSIPDSVRFSQEPDSGGEREGY